MILLRMAWRNIARNRKRSVILICAIVSGLVGVQFCMGNINGWMHELINASIRSYEGHIKIGTPLFQENPSIDTTFTDTPELRQAIQRLPVKGWGMRLRASGIVSVAEHTQLVDILGIDPSLEERISIIREAIHSGQYLHENEPGQILIGKRLADRFQTKVGRKVVLMSQQKNGDLGSGVYRIAGIFDTGLGSFDETTVYLLLPEAQTLLNAPQEISEITLQLDHMSEVNSFANTLKTLPLFQSLSVKTWDERLPFIMQTIKITNRFMAVFYFLFYWAMAFGIVNTLLIAIGERTHEIGVLRALGMSRFRLVILILCEALSLCAIGVVLGILLGWLLVSVLHWTGINLSIFSAGTQFMGVGHIIYPSIGLSDMASAGFSTILISLVFSLYPALHAARLVPIEAIRR